MVQLHESPDAQGRPSYRLYDRNSLAIATAFGSILAGFLLVGLNNRVLSDTGGARRDVALGVSGLALVLFLAWNLPEGLVVAPLLQATQVALVYWYVTVTHQGALESHRSSQGTFYSGWKAAGLGILVALVVLAGIFAPLAFQSADLRSERREAFATAPVDAFSWTVLRAESVDWVESERGTITAEGFLRELRQFPWDQQIQVAGVEGGPSPTLTLRHGGLDRYLAISGVGPSFQRWFYLFWGIGSTGQDPRFLPVQTLADVESLCELFFAAEVKELDRIFEEDGMPMERAFSGA